MATDYKEKAKQARLKVLEMIHKAGTSHIASNFSIIDVAVVLYSNLKAQDEVVWSKGWVAATIYYFLAQQGKIPQSDLELFGKEVETYEPVDSTSSFSSQKIKKEIKYLGLVETTTPGIWANAGSMGHGLPIACGMALARKLLKCSIHEGVKNLQAHEIALCKICQEKQGKIYCIMSDGEMNEGTTWESAMFAAHNKLDNLVVIVDKNKWQAMGKTEDVLNVNLSEAWRGFGWCHGRINGHDFLQIEDAFNLYLCECKMPRIIIADTIKGKGVSFMEDHLLYHYKHVDEENYKQAKEEIENS